MYGSGLAILEACLVYFRGYYMRASGLDPLEYCFFHDLRQVRPNNDGSNLIQNARTLRESLL